MRTKKIVTFWKVTRKEITPPPQEAALRRNLWVEEIQKTAPKDGVIIRRTEEIFNPEVVQMQRFFNGPVVIYWVIQSKDLLYGPVDKETIKQARETILSDQLGYTIQLLGRTERRRKSSSDFKSTQAWNDFLEMLRETEFEPNGYIFPNSEEFWELAQKFGYEEAKTISIEKLKKILIEKHKTP